MEMEFFRSMSTKRIEKTHNFERRIASQLILCNELIELVFVKKISIVTHWNIRSKISTSCAATAHT